MLGDGHVCEYIQKIDQVTRADLHGQHCQNELHRCSPALPDDALSSIKSEKGALQPTERFLQTHHEVCARLAGCARRRRRHTGWRASARSALARRPPSSWPGTSWLRSWRRTSSASAAASSPPFSRRSRRRATCATVTVFARGQLNRWATCPSGDARGQHGVMADCTTSDGACIRCWC